MYLPPKIPVHLSALLCCTMLYCGMFCPPLAAQTPVFQSTAPQNTTFQQTAMNLYQQGAEAERSGNIAAAETAYLNLLKQATDNNAVSFKATANHRLAVLKAREKKYPESEKYFQEACPFCENNVSFLCDYAKIYLDQNRFNAAEPLLKSAALSAPQDRKILYNLGCAVASQEGRQTEGLRYLKLSLGEKEAYRELAKIYRQQGKENEAGFALQRADQITANQPIPQITGDIQEQLKKELSFYESKRAVAKLNREAQQKEDLEKQQTEQDKLKLLPDSIVVNNSTLKILPSSQRDLVPSSAALSPLPPVQVVRPLPANTLPPTVSPTQVVRPLPADTENRKNEVANNKIINNKIAEDTKPKEEPVPQLRHLESAPPAVVQLMQPQKPEDLPKAQLRPANATFNPPEVAERKIVNETPQVKYEFARIDPQKNVSAIPKDEPVLAFRPKNDNSAYEPPVIVNEVEPQPEPKFITHWQESEIQQPFVFEEITANSNAGYTFGESSMVNMTGNVENPAENQIENSTAKTLPVETKPYEMNPVESSIVIDTAVVPVVRKPPVFEKPIIEHPQQETPQITWAQPILLPEESTTLEPVKELTKEAAKEQPLEVKEMPREVAKEQPLEVKETPREMAKEQPLEVKETPRELAKEQPLEVKEMPKELAKKQLLNVKEIPKESVKEQPLEVKETPREMVKERPLEVKEMPKEVAKEATKEQPLKVKEIPAEKIVAAVPKSAETKPDLPKFNLPKPVEHPSIVAFAPIPMPKQEPPMPVANNIKRTPSISMMSDAEFGETLQHIQSMKGQTVEDEMPAGFARTKKSILTADTTAVNLPYTQNISFDNINTDTLTVSTSASTDIGGFARSSSFAKFPPSVDYRRTVPVQTAAVVEEPPTVQQEFRPLFFRNSAPPQQKRKW